MGMSLKQVDCGGGCKAVVLPIVKTRLDTYGQFFAALPKMHFRLRVLKNQTALDIVAAKENKPQIYLYP